MKKSVIFTGLLILFSGCEKDKGKRKIDILKDGYKTLAPAASEELIYPFLKEDTLVVDVNANDAIYCMSFLENNSDTTILYSDSLSISPYDYHNTIQIPENGLVTLIIQNLSSDTLRIYRYYVRIRWE